MLGASSGPAIGMAFKAKAEAKKKAKEAKEAKKNGVVLEEENKEDDKPPFELRGIDVKIERGNLVCVVGTVGSGKVRVAWYFLSWFWEGS